jgi:hypothetical protein
MTFLLMRRFPASYHITYIAYVTNGKLLRHSLNCRLIPRNRSANGARGIVPECRTMAKKAGGSGVPAQSCRGQSRFAAASAFMF